MERDYFFSPWWYKMHTAVIIPVKFTPNYWSWSNQKLVAVKLKLELNKSAGSYHWNSLEIFMGHNLTIIIDQFP